MAIEDFLLWNTAWIFIWAIMTTIGTVTLFFGRGNGLYRAMRIHGIFVAMFLYLTAMTTYVNVVLYPDARYVLAMIRAIIVPIIVGTIIHIGVELKKARAQ